MTFGEIEKGVDLTRQQDLQRQKKLKREQGIWNRPGRCNGPSLFSRMHGRSEALAEDALIAATAGSRTHRSYKKRARFRCARGACFLIRSGQAAGTERTGLEK